MKMHLTTIQRQIIASRTTDLSGKFGIPGPNETFGGNGGSTYPGTYPVKEKKKGGGLFGGLKRVVGGTADQLTGNLFDFDKKSGGGLIRKTAGADGGLFGGDKKEGGSKGGSSGILGPISSNVDAMVNTDKYEVKPKEKKNTVVAYEQAVNEQQQQESVPEGGNEIPKITIKPPFIMEASKAKISVLGII